MVRLDVDLRAFVGGRASASTNVRECRIQPDSILDE
jgi:hypothetical protein